MKNQQNKEDMEVDKNGELINDEYHWSVKVALGIIAFVIVLIIIKG